MKPTRLRSPTPILTGIALLFHVSCAGGNEADGGAMARAANRQLPRIKQKTNSLNVAAVETEFNKADLPLAWLGIPGSDAEKRSESQVEWPAPSEVVIVLLSSHEQVDRTPAAARVSAKIRSMGSTALEVNGSGYTPVPGGMMKRVLDSMTIKSGGSGGKIVWQQKDIERIVSATEALGGEYVIGAARLKEIGANSKGQSTSIVEKFDNGIAAAAQLARAAREVLAAQQASANGKAPDQKAIEAAVEKILVSGSELREAAVSLSQQTASGSS